MTHALDLARAARARIADNSSYGDGGIDSRVLEKIDDALEAVIAEHDRETAEHAAIQAEGGPGQTDNSPERLAYEVGMMLNSVASHGPAALATTTDPMYTARLLRRLRDALVVAADHDGQDPFTPSTAQVRSHYVFDQSNRWSPDRGAAFDRWLEETLHDATRLLTAENAVLADHAGRTFPRPLQEPTTIVPAVDAALAAINHAINLPVGYTRHHVDGHTVTMLEPHVMPVAQDLHNARNLLHHARQLLADATPTEDGSSA